MIDTIHIPVMLEQCIEALHINPQGIYVDATAGMGGHSLRIAEQLTTGKLICIDKDAQAQEICKQNLASQGEKVSYVHSDFRTIETALSSLGIEKVDGILADLGVSSLQLDMAERGFSFRNEAALDMRMNPESALTAFAVINTFESSSIANIFFQYGEEKYANQIARAIVANRPVMTTTQLSDIICQAMPGKSRAQGQHPARRCFQGLRIYVNDEMGALDDFLAVLPKILKPDGRCAILSFHSLEDRRIKQALTQYATGCQCPPDFPVCVCNQKAIMSKQVRQFPSEEEIERNPRSKSATLRSAKRLETD
jgi:16S rRNA (cytosine1402-N4)-methyltransferase